MGSFQQVVMGGICLVAAFWFGSYINDQPTNPQQTLEGISSASLGTGNSQFQAASPQAKQPQSGLLSSFLDPSAKQRSVTLEDLKSRSMSPARNVVAQGQRSANQLIDSTTEVVSDFVGPPTPEFKVDPSFTANNLSAQAVSDTQIEQQPLEITFTQPRDQQRLEIVPDFSTLAEDYKRQQAQQFRRSNQLTSTQPANKQSGSLLPVPKLDEFSNASFGGSFQQPNRDWNAVRQGVMSVEEKLKQFRNAHPVAEDFEPLRSIDSTIPVATMTTGARFVPTDRAAVDEADRREAQQLETSLEEYERQELARQEALRQEFLKRRPLAFVPANQLPTDNQFTGRDRDQRFEPSPRSVEPESFAQRQERWKVFGDRALTSQTEFSAQDVADDYSAQNQSATGLRPSDVSVIPENSRVRSLYNMPLEDEARVPDRVAGRREVQTRQNVSRSLPQQRVAATVPLANDAGPEVIRYGDFKTYITEGGDTLQTISESFFGTPEYYFDLYLANRNVLANPATVPAGVELKIPRMGQ